MPICHALQRGVQLPAGLCDLVMAIFAKGVLQQHEAESQVIISVG